MKKFIRIGAAIAMTAGLMVVGTILSPVSNAITIGGKVETTVGPHMAIGGCSGTLVSRKWVITAWHCYGDSPLSDEIGYWGNLDYEKGNRVRVVQACHRYDMAMVRIDPPLPDKLPANVSIAQVHTVAPPVGSTVTIKGWGENEFGKGTGGGILRSTDAKVVNPWANGFGDAFGGPSFTLNKLPGGAISAHGDSGGPVYYEGKIVGITSNGDGVGANDVKAEAHLNWINALLAGQSLPQQPSPAAACISS